MNNQDYIVREAALVVNNTHHLYGTALTLNINDTNAVERFAQEVIVTIEDNAGEKFLNFNSAVRLALTTVAVESYKLQEETEA